MSSPETFLAFGAIMLIIALIGVAIDWFGTPLRHRKFIPKAYKFPDERLFRSDIFSSSRRTDIQPSTEHPEGSNYRDMIAAGKLENTQTESNTNEDSNEAIVEISESSKGEAKLPIKSSAGEETIDRSSELIIGDESESSKSSAEPEFEATTAGIRLRGWSPGDDIYNLTKSGSEPTPSTVRSRFWKNVGVSPGAIIFGTSNVERLRDGKPPQRRNPRTSKYETMKVHLLSYEDGHGRTPIPNWPNSSVDPFGDRN
tara:strand:+ start:6710 stop:7477 length:768 start_codon:yes stop_codon:yes gene_type:complete